MQPRPRLYARLDHETGSDHLLVCFNSYASPARGVSTQLENFGWLSRLGVSTLWFAEDGPRGWYTGFDREINDWIGHAVAGHGLRRVTLLGSSCGAYASIRHALLLAGTAAPGGPALDIHAIAINPQTGFGDDLLNGIRADLTRAGWRADELGSNPVIPAPQDLSQPADSIPITDLRQLGAAAGKPGAPVPSIAVLFDASNPIDRGFGQHLATLPGVALHPEPLGLHHADGARWFWQSAAFRRQVEQRVSGAEPVAGAGVGAAKADPVGAERVRLLLNFAASRAA